MKLQTISLVEFEDLANYNIYEELGLNREKV